MATKVEGLIELIIKKRKEFLQGELKRYPREYPIASDIPDCDRYIVHSILDWQQKKMFDEYVQAMLIRGNTEEKQVTKDMLDLGLEIIENQTPFEARNAKGILCRGKIDGKLKFEGQKYPYEIKSMNVNSFNSIRNIDDLQKRPHFRKYLRQIQLYLFGHNAEEGLFIFTDLQGHYKLIPVYLDYGECELLLQRLEKVQVCLAKKEYPDRINYDERICGKCAFAHVCLPDTKSEGASVIEDPDLECALERREELKPLAKEYGDIDDDIKERFRERPDTIIGVNWRILAKASAYKKLNTKAIPEDIKKQYMEDAVKVAVSIININAGK